MKMKEIIFLFSFYLFIILPDRKNYLFFRKEGNFSSFTYQVQKIKKIYPGNFSHLWHWTIPKQERRLCSTVLPTVTCSRSIITEQPLWVSNMKSTSMRVIKSSWKICTMEKNFCTKISIHFNSIFHKLF